MARLTSTTEGVSVWLAGESKQPVKRREDHTQGQDRTGFARGYPLSRLFDYVPGNEVESLSSDPMQRLRKPLILLLALACAFSWLPLHGIDDEPLVLTMQGRGWSSAGVESSGITYSAAALAFGDQTDGGVLQSRYQATPLAVERIWIVGLDDSRLLREVGLALAHELTEVPGVREVAWFPRSSQPLTVRRTPDLWVILELNSEETLHLPGYCDVKASVRASMGRDPLTEQPQGPWREAISGQSWVETSARAIGLVSAGARYKVIAKNLTDHLNLQGTLKTAIREHGFIASPPLDPSLATFDVPDSWGAAVGENARVVQAGRPPGMEGEVLWEFTGDPQALLQRLEDLGFVEAPAAQFPFSQRIFQRERETITLTTRKGSTNPKSLLLWRRALNQEDLNRWLATSPAHERVGDGLLRNHSWPGSATRTVLNKAIAEGVFPGTVAIMGGRNQPARVILLGQLGLDKRTSPRATTLWDLASLTKVVSTTTLALLLEEEGLLSLSDPLGTHLPEFLAGAPQDSPRRQVRLDHLLTHTSGLPPWKPFYTEASSYQELLALVQQEPLEHAPGKMRAYSDLGLILLGAALEACTQTPLAVLEQDRIFRPLGLTSATRNPLNQSQFLIAPTEEREEGGYHHGVVHDENSRAAGGQTAHAGLFASGLDLAAFCREWLRVEKDEARILPKSALDRVLSGAHGQRLGWQRAGESYPGLGPRTLYHTGFTGTALWIDPDQDLFLILLTNRVHPSREGKGIGEARRAFVAAALLDAQLR